MRAEELEALREDMLAVIAAGAFALRDTIGKSAFDERVMTAMRKVSRHEFVPIELQPYAYANTPLPIGFGKEVGQSLPVHSDEQTIFRATPYFALGPMLSKKSQTDLRPISCRKTKHATIARRYALSRVAEVTWRVRRLMTLPPTQLRDGRTYGSENSRSAMQKDFFDSIGHKRTSDRVTQSIFTTGAGRHFPVLTISFGT
jgi:hypothetical protein